MYIDDNDNDNDNNNSYNNNNNNTYMMSRLAQLMLYRMENRVAQMESVRQSINYEY